MSRHEKDYFHEWESDEDDFFNKVRVESRWDEAHFQRMMSVAGSLLDEMNAQNFEPGRWDFAFTEGTEILIGLLTHPGFLAENTLGMASEEYREYIGKRVEQLKGLRARYEDLRRELQQEPPPQS